MNEFGIEESQFSRIEFDYKQLLLQHLSNLSRLVSFNFFINPPGENMNMDALLEKIDEITTKNLKISVDMLEAFLSPYFDEAYKKAKEAFKKEHPEDDSELTWSDIKTKAVKKLSFLMQLMDRNDFLKEQTKTVDVA